MVMIHESDFGKTEAICNTGIIKILLLKIFHGLTIFWNSLYLQRHLKIIISIVKKELRETKPLESLTAGLETEVEIILSCLIAALQ